MEAGGAQPARPAWDLGGRRVEVLLAEARRYRGESLARKAWRRLRADRSAWLSLIFLSGVCLLSLFAPLLPLPSPVAMRLRGEPQAPVWPWVQPANSGFQREYAQLSALDELLVGARVRAFGPLQTGAWLGTDAKGRDLLARIMWGSRTSILVALAAALTSLLIGVTYGALAGLSGGPLDRRMMRLVDVLYSLPFIFLVIFVLTLLSAPREDLAGQPLLSREKVFFVVLGAVWWLTMARVVRGQVLALRSSGYVQAARALGASTARILWTHVLPNVMPVVVVYLTLTLPAVMLFEAFLSFLGLGIAPPDVSWGLLAADGIDAINPLRVYWWLIAFPSLAMGSTLLALNLLGDGLRDALDPRQAPGPGPERARKA